MGGFRQGDLQSSFNANILQNKLYLEYINQNEQINEHFGYGIWAQREFMFSNSVSNINADFFYSEQICIQCAEGFGLTLDQLSCQACPSGCLLCLNAFDNSCIANSAQELALYVNGQTLSSCNGFLSPS